MSIQTASFCAIGDFPYKALNNKSLLTSVSNRMLKPIHAVIIPTNACNLDCSFCCCCDREKNDHLSNDAIQHILNELSALGTKAITLSGGGEPLLSVSILDTIQHIQNLGMKTGLVTNGTLLKKLHKLPRNALEWCRISFGDGRTVDDVEEIIATAASLTAEGIIGLAGISYVITSQLDIPLVDEVIRCAQKYRMNYVKFILDEKNCEYSEYPEYVTNLQYENKIITPIAWKSLNHVSCLLHLIKPIFAADGFVYPCCENQYNNADGSWRYSDHRRIMSYTDYFTNINEQTPYTCKQCPKCFHPTLMAFLNSTKKHYIHEDFI